MNEKNCKYYLNISKKDLRYENEFNLNKKNMKNANFEEKNK